MQPAEEAALYSGPVCLTNGLEHQGNQRNVCFGEYYFCNSEETHLISELGHNMRNTIIVYASVYICMCVSVMFMVSINIY